MTSETESGTEIKVVVECQLCVVQLCTNHIQGHLMHYAVVQPVSHSLGIQFLRGLILLHVHALNSSIHDHSLYPALCHQAAALVAQLSFPSHRRSPQRRQRV